MLLRNAIVVDSWTSPGPIGRGDVRIEGSSIAERGESLLARDGERVVDLDGAILAPGFVCGHTHLYSVLSRGMPATSDAPPRDFHEILQKVWWRLDVALDEPSVRASARIGAIEALKCGTTGLIDHHASPFFVDGSLDVIAQACRDIGIRALLCYETSDRDGEVIAAVGIAENARFCAENGRDDIVAGVIGAHASFTCSDHTLDRLGTAAQDAGTGLHVHVAEGGTDRTLTRQRYGAELIARYQQRGFLHGKSIFAHCVDLTEAERAALQHAGVKLAHNPSSNLNNRVGFAPLWAENPAVMLGTDGIGADMYREAKSAWFRGMEADASCSPGAILGMIANAATTLYDHLGVAGGRIEAGQAADLQVLRYRTPTDLHADNLGGHFLFGMSAAAVESVIVAGKIVVDRGVLVGVDLEREYAVAREQASGLWQRMLAKSGSSLRL